MISAIFSTFVLIYLVHFGVYGTLCSGAILDFIDYLKPGTRPFVDLAIDLYLQGIQICQKTIFILLHN